ILILDPVHRIVEINGAMKRIFDSCDTCIGQPVDVLAKQHEGLVSICRENSYYEGEITLDAESPHYFDINISEIFDSNRQLLGKIVMLYDITHKKQIEKQLVRKNALLEDRVFEVEKLQEKLSEQALKDPLTGLFNRRFLAEVVEKEASRARRESSTFGLCMIDIDNFKSVNDRFGHDAGDYVLMRVSDTMSSLMRRTDYLCRFGGDELIIILPKIGKQDAVVKAEQLCNALSRINFEIAGERIEVTLSIGIALFPEDGSSFEQLMQKADAALYNSKRCGRNRITVYDSSLKP
ncbi:MAG: diguanylate cyclase, partial [Spirochaetota bacterium]